MSINNLNNLMKNPVYEFVASGKCLELKTLNEIEREYTIDRAPNYKNLFVINPGDSNVIKLLDHNKLLELYPLYDTLYGPYTDSNENKFSSVFILYRKIDRTFYVKVIYATRAIIEISQNSKLDDTFDENSQGSYEHLLSKLVKEVNPKGVRKYYIAFTDVDKLRTDALKVYSEYTSMYNPDLNPTRGFYTLKFHSNDKRVIASGKGDLLINLNRVLYETYVLKRRLKDSEQLRVINGKPGDIRLENLTHVDMDEVKNNLIQEAMQKYKLDVNKLERIYANSGYSRFRGIYKVDSDNVKNSNYGRMYVKMVRDGTDKQISIFLARALMEVHVGRMLTEDETVDHINHDKTDDRVDNLRVLSRSQHSADDAVRVEIDPINCAICNKKYYVSAKEMQYHVKVKNHLVCSDNCFDKLTKHRSGTLQLELYPQELKYRYYVLGKNGSPNKYFDSLDYNECRQQINATHRTD